MGGTGGQAVAEAARRRGCRSRDRLARPKRARAAEPLGAEGAGNDDAVRGADLVLFAVKADAAVESAAELRPVDRLDAGLLGLRQLVRPGRGEADGRGDLDRAADPGRARRAGRRRPALLAASNLADAPPDEDAFVCGDDEVAKRLALDLASQLVSGRAVDCGPLASARALEGMTAVIVNVNKRYKAHAGLRLTGLK